MAETTPREFAVQVRPTQDRFSENFAQFSQMFERKKELAQERQIAAAKFERDDQAKMQDYLDKVSDPSKLYTGIAGQDQQIDIGLGSIVQTAAAMKKAGYSTAEIQSRIRPGMMEIGKYSNATKNTVKAIDDDLKTFGNSESLDMDKLKKQMYREAFENYDEKEQAYRPKAADDIRPTSVYDVLKKNPERFVKLGKDGEVVHQDLSDYLGKQKLTNKVVDSYADYDVQGKQMKRTKEQYSVDMLLGQEVYFDKDKRGNQSPKLRFKYQEEEDVDPANKGKTVKIVSDEAYNQYFADPRTKAALIVETRLRNGGKPIDESTAEGQQKMKAVALDLLEKKAVGSKIARIVDNSLQATPGIHVTVNTGDKEAAATLKKAKGTAGYAFMQYAGGKLKPPASAYDKEGFAEVSRYFPGGAMMSMKEEGEKGGLSTQALAGVYINKKNGQMYYQENKGDKKVMIKPEKRYDWLAKRVTANGMPMEVFNDVYQEMFPGENPESKSEGYRIAYDDVVDAFKKTGSVTAKSESGKSLSDYNGDYFELNIGTKSSPEKKRVQVNAIDHKLKSDVYTVWYTSGGKELKKEFNKEQMETILANHYED